MIINKNILYLVVFIITLFSCRNSVNNGKVIIDLEYWNKSTYDFLNGNCKVDLDTLKLGFDNVAVKYKGKVFVTMNQYIKYCFSHRKSLIEYLEANLCDIKQVSILERYDMKEIVYIIQINGKKLLILGFENGGIVLLSKENENFSHLFSKSKDEKDCFNNYISLPQHFLVFSNYLAIDKKIVINKVSLSN